MSSKGVAMICAIVLHIHVQKSIAEPQWSDTNGSDIFHEHQDSLDRGALGSHKAVLHLPLVYSRQDSRGTYEVLGIEHWAHGKCTVCYAVLSLRRKSQTWMNSIPTTLLSLQEIFESFRGWVWFSNPKKSLHCWNPWDSVSNPKLACFPQLPAGLQANYRGTSRQLPASCRVGLAGTT